MRRKCHCYIYVTQQHSHVLNCKYKKEGCLFSDSRNDKIHFYRCI